MRVVDMTFLVFGLLLFLGVHSVSIVAPGWRQRWIATHGEKPWKGLYAVVAGVGLAALIVGYGLARQHPVILWAPPRALRHVAWLLMVPVFPLLLATYLPGRISRIAKHPMLLAVKLWATAHLLANGTLDSVLLFGAFLAWAVADRISLKRRPVAFDRGPASGSVRPVNDVLVVVAGLALYVAFILRLHLWLIGVSPLA